MKKLAINNIKFGPFVDFSTVSDLTQSESSKVGSSWAWAIDTTLIDKTEKRLSFNQFQIRYILTRA